MSVQFRPPAPDKSRVCGVCSCKPFLFLDFPGHPFSETIPIEALQHQRLQRMQPFSFAWVDDYFVTIPGGHYWIVFFSRLFESESRETHVLIGAA